MLNDEQVAYELAFHLLPTVAEGEVPATFTALKEQITKAGATVTDEEAPERFELAYEIEKVVEGVNRKFTSAYFGWVRFSAAPAAIGALTEEAETHPSVLRHLLIRLTRVEEENPFRFHEALASEKQVRTVEEHEVSAAAAPAAESASPESAAETASESPAEESAPEAATDDKTV